MLRHPGRKARLRGTFWAGLDLIPNALIGLVLLLGALAVGQHELTLGGLVAFITLALLLVWPIEAMGYILAGGQEAATAAQRVYEILDTAPAISSPAGPPAGPRAGRPAGGTAAGWSSTTSGSRYPGAAEPLLRGREPGRSSPGRPSPWSGPPGRARPRCCTWCPGWPT